MTIQIGDRIPDASLSQLQDGVQTLSTRDLFDDRKVLLFSVPGAFTPTCSTKHRRAISSISKRFSGAVFMSPAWP